MRGFVGLNDKPPSPPPPKARHSRTTSPSGTVRNRNKLEEGVELSREPWLRHRTVTTAAGNGGSNNGNSWIEEDQNPAAVSSLGAAENGQGVSITMGGANGRLGGRVGRVGLGGSSSNGYEQVNHEEPLLEREEADELSEGEQKEKVGREQEMPDTETMPSAGLLWSTGSGDNPSLRSRGDASLGPAFGSRVVVTQGSSMSGLNGYIGEGDMNGDPGREDESWAISGRPLVYLCAVCSSLCSILLGYDVGVMSGAKEYMKPDLDLSEARLEGIVGSLNIVAAFGGLLAGKAADRLGRKPTTGLACVVFITGATMMTMSQSFAFLLLGRVVTGIGVGCAMVIAPVYITELAPPDVRGMLVSLTDICINIGIVLGNAASLVCADLFESDSGKWRSMIGIGIAPPVLIVVCLAFMPESPRWLISAGREVEAFTVLKRVLGDNEEAAESHRTISQATSNHAEATWRDVLLPTDRAVKAAMFVGVALGFWQQASGSEAAVYYTPEVLAGSGWNQNQILLGNIGVGGFKLLGEVVAFMLLDRIGRRPLFLTSSFLVTICLLMVGVSFTFVWHTEMVLFWLCMFMFCFSLGLGPVTFVVASEMFPVAVRGKAMSVVVFVNRFMSGAIALSYETMTGAITAAGTFYIFSFLSAVSVFFYAYWVPETSGRTLEEITADLGSSSSPGIQVGRGGARHYPLPEEDDESQ